VTTVEDDGVGFAPAGSGGPREGHFGLALLRDRASDFGGELTIDSAPGRGTAIRLEVPEP
jgi:signal transduction histidine kinase